MSERLFTRESFMRRIAELRQQLRTVHKRLKLANRGAERNAWIAFDLARELHELRKGLPPENPEPRKEGDANDHRRSLPSDIADASGPTPQASGKLPIETLAEDQVDPPPGFHEAVDAALKEETQASGNEPTLCPNCGLEVNDEHGHYDYLDNRYFCPPYEAVLPESGNEPVSQADDGEIPLATQLATARDVRRNQEAMFKNRIQQLIVENVEKDAEIARLTAERDESDRRAGNAERRLEFVQDSVNKRMDWLDKAKDQWGVNRNTSFDVVWEECLDLKKDRDRLSEELREAIGQLQKTNLGFGALAPKGTWLSEVMENIWRAESAEKAKEIGQQTSTQITKNGLWIGPRELENERDTLKTKLTESELARERMVKAAFWEGYESYWRHHQLQFPITASEIVGTWEKSNALALLGGKPTEP